MWFCSYYMSNGYERQILKQITEFILILVGFWPAPSRRLWLWGVDIYIFILLLNNSKTPGLHFLYCSNLSQMYFLLLCKLEGGCEFQKAMEENIICFLPRGVTSSADLVLKKHSDLHCLCLWRRAIIINVASDTKILCSIVVFAYSLNN